MYKLNARDRFNWSPLLFSWPAPRNRCSQMERGVLPPNSLITLHQILQTWLCDYTYAKFQNDPSRGFPHIGEIVWTRLPFNYFVGSCNPPPPRPRTNFYACHWTLWISFHNVTFTSVRRSARSEWTFVRRDVRDTLTSVARSISFCTFICSKTYQYHAT